MNFFECHLYFLGQDLDCDNSTAKIISVMMGYGKEKMPDGVQLVVSLIRPALGQPWRQKPSICLISPCNHIDRDQDRGLS